jgi:hypothetical protein
MRGVAFKILAAAALLAAVVVPSAAAKSSAALKLSVLPLPKSSIGSAVRGLKVGNESGVVTNLDAANNTFGDALPDDFTHMGRITGYGLQYGNESTGLSGVDSVWTSVDVYKTAKDAKRGVAFWKKDDALAATLNQGGFSVTNRLVKVPRLGSARFGDLTSFSASNIAPVSSFDVEIAEGRSVLDVMVWAGTSSKATALGTKLAKKLDARFHLALEGRLHAKPVKLPKPADGPPVGGPDLSKMGLVAGDLTGQTTVVSSTYAPVTRALSDYEVFMFPAGPFDILGQEIEWYANANEANFEADFETASELSLSGSAPLDLSSLGDGAQGAIENDSSGGEALVAFSTGHLAEYVYVLGLESGVQQSDVMSVAQTAANKIDAALGSK